MTWVAELIGCFLVGLWCLGALGVIYWILFEWTIFPLARAVRRKREARRRKSEYDSVYKDSRQMPIIDQCVKIVENNAQACEVLEFIGRNQIEEKEKEKMNKMPKLKSGDVFKDVNGRWFLVVTEKEGYIIDPTNRRISMHYFLETVNPVEIYRETDGDVFGANTLERIINGKPVDASWLFWKKPEPVKEMTVDQISEALGYTVKVVGNE